MKEYTRLEEVTYQVYTYDEIVDLFNDVSKRKGEFLRRRRIH